MIARIQGTVIESAPLRCVLDLNGIGYEIHIPVTTAEKIPPHGESATLFTHAVYREDSATLYGFAASEDRDFFRLLVERVSGIGPKIGIGILSRMSVELLRNAIAASDIALLAKCPGIGRKTAERLVIELKDKVFADGMSPAFGKTDPATNTNPPTSNYQDAVASLMTLGYKPAEADKLIRKASTQLPAEASVEALIRTALG
ncbi:MAG: Holliday junction ATP-dependent DNA helicase RuvA [Opitutia bacterium UBA7350]|nr:MAG: Holliday junction ATP-dependent DNA helicase RuvA [Opitutae bacterium UBA7350]